MLFIKNFLNGYYFNRDFLFNSEQFSSTPNYYERLTFSDLKRDYILQDDFLLKNNLNLLYSPQKTKVHFGRKNLQKKDLDFEFSPYEKISLENEVQFARKIGSQLIESKKRDPSKELSYEFSNRGVSLKIK